MSRMVKHELIEAYLLGEPLYPMAKKMTTKFIYTEDCFPEPRPLYFGDCIGFLFAAITNCRKFSGLTQCQ